MRSVAWITDTIYLTHDTGVGHPESIARLEAINQAIIPLLPKLISLSPRAATRAEIQQIHHPALIEQVQTHSQLARAIDADTILSTGSYLAAKKAAGAALVAIDGIQSGKFERAFCAVRPPGHHATPTQSMGFCLFNNIAIAARYAQSRGYAKVMIIDFDVHHGNGTQDAFYADDTVFYFSTHQAFAYPGTGAESHRGEGRGRGYTANHPLMPDSGDAEILEIYAHDLSESYHFFNPDILLISAGYDLHESDPLAQLHVTTEGIRGIVHHILDLGDAPVVFMLEGGYSVEHLAENVVVTVEEMLQ